MKKKLILLTTFALVALLVVGGTMAWFTGYAESANNFKMGTVEIVVEDNFDHDGAQKVNPGSCYKKEVAVTSKGNKATYVRVQLIPEWNRDVAAIYVREGTTFRVIGANAVPQEIAEQYGINANNSAEPQFILPIKCEKCGEWYIPFFGHKCKNPGDGGKEEDNWILRQENDGNWYYYYKKILYEGQTTDFLIKEVCFDGKTIGDEFQGAHFTLIVKAEAVQATNNAYKDVWGINDLPEGVEVLD